MANTNLDIVISAKDNASKTIKNVEGSLGGLGGILKVGAAGFLAAGTAAVAFGTMAAKAASESEAQMAIVSQQIKNSGLDFESTSKKINEFAGAFQRATGYGDEMVAQVASRLLPVLKDTEAATELTALAFDAQAAGLGDAENAAKALALAHEGDIAMLSKMVPALRLADEEMLKNMTSAERAAFALDKAKEAFGGTAEVAGNTFAGQVKIVKENFGDLLETIGSPIIQGLGTVLGEINAKFQEWKPSIDEAIAKFNELGGVSGIFEKVKKSISDTIVEIDLQTGVVTTLKEAWDGVWESITVNLMPAFQEFWTALQPYLPFLEKLAVILGAVLVGSINILITTLGIFLKILIFILAKGVEFAALMMNSVRVAIETVTGFFKAMGEAVQFVIDKIKDLIKWIADAAKAMGGAAFSKIGNFFGKAGQILGSPINALTGGNKQFGGSVSGGTPYLVGERGAEMFVPRQDGTIVPNSQLGGGSINVFVTGTFMSEDAAEAMGTMIVDKLKMQGVL